MLRSILKHKIISTLIAVGYFIIPSLFNIYYLNKLKSSFNEEIRKAKKETIEETLSQCDSNTEMVTSKFYLSVSDLRDDVSELKYQNKTVDEEFVFLSNEYKDLQEQILLLAKRGKRK